MRPCTQENILSKLTLEKVVEFVHPGGNAEVDCLVTEINDDSTQHRRVDLGSTMSEN